MEIAIIGVLAVVVIAAVALPLFRGARSGNDAREFSTGSDAHEFSTGTGTEATSPADAAGAPASFARAAGGADAALETEIARYREAVAAGTVCARCGEANARGAKFCADCGKPLGAAADAQEFA